MMLNSRIFWTFQRKDIMFNMGPDKILMPDFSTLENTENADRLPAYRHILNDYNTINHTEYRGLVFGHLGGDSHPQINTINELYELLDINGEPGGTVYPPSTHMLLKVIIPEDIAILQIDFYRFVDLMSVFMDHEPEERCKRVISNLYMPNGADSMWDVPGSNGKWELIQAHVPFIKEDWIEAVYVPYDK